MSPSNVLLVVVILSLSYLAEKVATYNGTTCDSPPISGRELSSSIDIRRNTTGEWVTTFGAERTTKGNETDMNMVVNHMYFECQGKTTVKIQGVIKDIYHSEFPFVNQLESVPEPTVSVTEYLRFHQRCGSNVNITENGKSLQKIKIDKWNDGVAFTNRPLKDDELFEVVIGARGEEKADAIGIGVTTHSPDTIIIPAHMNSITGAWMMYLSNVYKDGSSIKKYFMKNLKEMKVGERIGVKRTSKGDLHLLINGVDQGIAANNLPSPVYGVFELYEKVYKVTMIDH